MKFFKHRVRFDKEKFLDDIKPESISGRSVASKILMFDQAKKIISHTRANIARPFLTLSSAARLFLKSPDDGFRATGRTAEEKFSSMISHYKLDDSAIEKKIKDSAKAFDINILVAAASFIAAFYLSSMSLYLAILCSIFSIKAFAACVVNYQFRSKKVVSISEFLKSRDYLPK